MLDPMDVAMTVLARVAEREKVPVRDTDAR